MFTLDGILKKPIENEEYLKFKREQLRVIHVRIRTEITAAGENPRHKNYVLRCAQEYMQNLYCLAGTNGQSVFLGNPPAWKKRIVPDPEFIYALNRLPGLTVLSEAYLLTEEIAYAEKALGDLTNWIDECPFPPVIANDPVYLHETFNRDPDITPWRILEVGIRLFRSFRDAYLRLLYTECMTAQVHEKIVLSIYEHARNISIISPQLWPNADHNHYFHELLGLFAAACLFPEWNESKEWYELAMSELLRCCRVQFTPEGGQIEGCPMYHNHCLSMIYTWVEILTENGHDLPAELERCIQRALDYTAWTLKPTGLIASIGDSVESPGAIKNQAEQYRSLFGRSDVYDILEPLIYNNDSDAGKGGIVHFKTLGQIIARTGWSKNDSYFLFMCNTPVPNNHSHQDPMNFLLTLNGIDVITDPSFFTYTEGEARKLFKSPEYHSCLTFGNRPPFEYISSWFFGPQKIGHTVKTYEAEGLFAGDAYHTNYDPNMHQRLCALIDKDVFVVVDNIKNVTKETIRMYFHMNAPIWRKTEFGAKSDDMFIFLPDQCTSEIVDSRRALTTDNSVASQRIIVTDNSCTENALYLSLFTICSNIKNPCTEHTDEGIIIRYEKGTTTIKIHWIFGKSCIKVIS